MDTPDDDTPEAPPAAPPAGLPRPDFVVGRGCGLAYDIQSRILRENVRGRLTANDLAIGMVVRFRRGCAKLGRIMADDQPMIVVAKMAPIALRTASLYDELNGAQLDVRVGILDAEGDMHEFSVAAGWLEIIGQ